MSRWPNRDGPDRENIPTPDSPSAYRHYVLAILFLVYVFNFVDRRLLSILLVPIQEDLRVSDTVMGLLTGPVFAVFYTFTGIPIARWADSGVRRSIIALGLTVWSGMTALSGLAHSSLHLALTRIGVGVGEAACSPPAHSLLSDYFPPHRRATAISIYSTGIFIGILISLSLGGWLNESLGWRRAFIIAGLPGIALALLVRLTVREPVRGLVEGRPAVSDSPSTLQVFRFLWSLKSFRHMSLASALNSFAGYAFGVWTPAFFIHVHNMGTARTGLWTGLAFGLGGAIGTFSGGIICDRLGSRSPKWHLLVPAMATLLALPFTALALLWPTRAGALLFLVPAITFGAVYLGPVFSLTQGLVKLRMRALAAAVLLFIINLVGCGLGPACVGTLNDLLVSIEHGPGTEVVRYSLLMVGSIRLWAAVHFVLGTRTLEKDLLARNGHGGESQDRRN